MTARASMFILILTMAAAFLILSGCCGERQNIARFGPPTPEKNDLGQGTSVRTRSPVPYGKMKVPAELFVDLIQPKQGADPVTIIVTASSSVVAGSGVLTLRIPEINGELGRTKVLWAGDSLGFMAESLEYTMPSLSTGRYHFVAVIEFTPDREGAETLVLSESLYADVRASEILTSNVSFRQLERMALYRQLEDRALANLSPRSATATMKTTARFRQQMTAGNPDLVEREIARLRATDPDVTRQIMSLNSSMADTEAGSGTVGRSKQGPPVFEEAVPIR